MNFKDNILLHIEIIPILYNITCIHITNTLCQRYSDFLSAARMPLLHTNTHFAILKINILCKNVKCDYMDKNRKLKRYYLL